VFLAAEAAVAAGIGLVTVAVPQSLHAAAQARLAEPVTLATEETDRGTISHRALPALLEQARQARALAIGPGLGRHAETVELVLALLEGSAAPRVVDADGLQALADARDWGQKAGAGTVLTPHLGEMARLTGVDAAELEARRIDAALEWSGRWGVVVVLKGAPTVTASPDGRCTVNPSGNPGMASAGMGDVLTGTVLAFLAQGLVPYDAARFAAYVHGRAGDRVALRHGIALSSARLVAAEIPEALGELAMVAGRPPLPPPLPSRPITPRPD
jgi:NAD(P)H-hydrate epimerase